MCGVVGVSGIPEAAYLTAVGLHAVQHRGQEAAGIVSFDGEDFHEHREGGLAGRIFTKGVLQNLPGHAAIGHVRYSTSGVKQQDSILQARDAQPLVEIFPFGGLAIAHNGNLTNSDHLRHALMGAGHSFQSKVDTEVALKLIGSAVGAKLVDRLKMGLPMLEGAYAFLLLTKKKLIGVCDPYGIRPLVIGKMKSGAYVMASETCVLDALHAEYVSDVEAGTMVIVEDGKMETHRFADPRPVRKCIFEYVYFSRPDSTWGGKNVGEARERLGHELAREAFIDADIVVPIPDSGNHAALGYAEVSGIPFKLGIIRNHYVGRVFIQPTQEDRDSDVILKLSVNEAVVRGKRIVLIDDSLVRGTTAKRVIDRLKAAGATAVHLRITSPPWEHGCYYGIDEADVHRRVAKPHENSETVCSRVKEVTGADSVAYLSVNGMYRAVVGQERTSACPQACDACFTGSFPTSLTDLTGIRGGHVH